MKFDSLSLNVNEDDQQFELQIDQHTALIAYRVLDTHTLALDHTEVPEELEGQGIASALVEKTFQYLDDNQLKLVPNCSFVRTYLERHPDWKRLVA
ncbi:GNAT family N-acetyltransferase [Siphonobacter curvatus]|uniref:N-acetyltransferase n=1 Tax=Siphonobacter curvatus TaxID=2094562 RepID=A0A2S7IP60_9BACT|nr:GNAT family N-acetyltransferase [Siphonobacter curvatus]PQA59513.1 N-acetyltransferase [Siphonobacter curvatus]